MRQDDLREMYGRVNWENTGKFRDYHKIANIIFSFIGKRRRNTGAVEGTILNVIRRH